MKRGSSAEKKKKQPPALIPTHPFFLKVSKWETNIEIKQKGDRSRAKDGLLWKLPGEEELGRKSNGLEERS